MSKKEGIYLSAIVDKNGDTVLMDAARGGNKDKTKLLLEKDADVNAIDKDGKSALMKVWEFGYNSNSAEIIKLLIKADANVNAKDNNSDTVLIILMNKVMNDKFLQNIHIKCKYISSVYQ